MHPFIIYSLSASPPYLYKGMAYGIAYRSDQIVPHLQIGHLRLILRMISA